MVTRAITRYKQFKYEFRKESKVVWRKHPILLSAVIIWGVTSLSYLLYLGYAQRTRVAPTLHSYPPEVANILRRAVFFTEIRLDPSAALEEYRNALKVAIEMGLHPFSDEVVGIKIQVASMLEKAGLIGTSIEVLERTKNESLDWIEKSTKMASAPPEVDYEELARKRKTALAEATAAAKGEEVTLPKSSDGTIEVTDEEVEYIRKRAKEFFKFEERQRDRMLKKVIGIQLKLGELYMNDHIQDDQKSEAALVAAVELCLKELHRRQTLGLPVGIHESADPEAWLNLTEMATAFVELGSVYNGRGKHTLALPLYLRALDFIREEEASPTCKQVELLNDISSAMAGQAQLLPVGKQQQKKKQQSEAIPSREDVIKAAKQWAQKALDVASTVKPPIRDEICDSSCVAATYNLGELAEMAGQQGEATKRYREAESLAHSIGFEEGIIMAQTALERMRS